jgi:endonuclease/exonuclease/phosphatase family metal-dependent hydrolase
LKEFLKKFAFRINLLAVILLFLSYLAAWINPKYFWPISLMGALFPFMLIINAFFIVFWAILRKKYFLVSAIGLLIGYSFILRLVHFNWPTKRNTEIHNSSSIKILSYNVRLFNLYKWIDKPNTRDEILKFISAETPDLICLQEFYTKEKGSKSEESVFKTFPGIHYKYVKYSYKNKGISNFGIATYSKYPIIHNGIINFPNSYNQCIFTDIIKNSDTLRVYNLHLQSFRFLKKNYEFLDSLKLKYDDANIKGAKDILYRIKLAILKRASQTDSVAASIARCRYPVVVCGDFNEPPVSYSYQTLQKGLKDAFMETGIGFGDTYFSRFPSYRIDYIFHSPTLKATGYQSPKTGLSDHSPVICYIEKK